MKIDAVVGQILDKYDHNKDGTIEETQGEYDRTAVGICNTPYSADGFFRSADTNRDGLVTRKELAAAVAKYDANGDGQIERESWFQRNILSLFGVRSKPTEYDQFLENFESATNSCD